MRTNEELVDQWGPKCALCSEVMEERHLMQSIVPLEVKKFGYETYSYTKLYVVCTKCKDKGELI